MRLNIEIVTGTAEDHVILSSAALEGAVDRPQTLHFYEGCRDIILLGVRLIAGIAKDHCFSQGNKRTAFHSGNAFMELNEHFLDVRDTEENAKLILDLVNDDITEGAVAEVLRERLI